jgi:hypothetical protein
LAAEGHVSGYNKRDGAPFTARPWPRRLRPEWGTDDPGSNLLDDIADMRSRAELLTEQDQKFLRHVERAAVRSHADGSHSAFLSKYHYGKLLRMAHRHTDPVVASKFLRRLAEDGSRRLAAVASTAPEDCAAPSSPTPAPREDEDQGRHVPWTSQTYYSRGFAND